MTLLDVSCGSQVPSLALYPAGNLDFDLADGVLDWLDAIGMTLFDWQRKVLRHSMARRGKKWAAYEVDLIVPRQNGKNEILIALELAAANLLGVRLIIHSAHEAITAAKHFARFQELVNEDSPAYKPDVAKLFPKTKTQGFYTSNGKEHIEFANGALIEFRTRTKSAGRGFSAPLVVLDEAFDLPPKAVGSLQYTMRAKPNAQFWKTSSAAHEGSVVLHNDRRRAQAADPDDSRLLYMEWGNESGVDPSDPATWLRSNPSLGCEAPGFELDIQTFRNEYASAKGEPDLLTEFVREVCGVPEAPGSGVTAEINAEDWAMCGPPEGSVHPWSTIVSHEQFALAVSPDRKWAAFGIAGRNAAGKIHVECIDRQSGTTGVHDFVVKVWNAKKVPIRIYKAGAENSFIARLREAGVEVVEVSGPEVTQATGQFIDEARAGGLAHLDQAWLNAAVETAERKPNAEGASAWSQRTRDVTPLMACTVALGGVPQLSNAFAGGFTDLDEFLDDEEA